MKIILLLLSAFISLSTLAQPVCNSSGNLMIFSNYDGGTLTINVDQNIPNLKIGVCSYEGVAIFLTGAFVGNVTGITYAGYNGSNNHCGSIINTNINGATSNATQSIIIMPTAPISNPNGYPSIICAYSCNNNITQGGCNTVDQVEAYFLNHFSGSTLLAHKIQYGCWTGTHNITGGGNCCPPVPTFPGTVTASQTLCAGQTPAPLLSSIAASGGTGPITYTWQASTTSTNAGFTNIPGANSSTYAPSSLVTTTYYRRAASTATNNTSYSNVITVTVFPNPSFVIGGPAGVCPGGTATLVAGGGFSYTWMPGNTTGSTLPINPVGPGTYTALAMSANGCTNTAQKNIVIHALPVITAVGPATTCAGNPITLSGTGGIAYSWMPGNLSGGTVTVTPMFNTTYTVTGTDANGCMNTSTIQPSVMAAPVIAAISSNPGGVCQGEQLTLAANGASTYTWMPGNLQGASVNVTLAVSTNFTVTGTSSAGCSNSLTMAQLVDPTPTVTAVLGSVTACEGAPVSAIASGATSYTWMPGPYIGAAVTVTAAGTTIFTVTGEDMGCADEATVTLNTLPAPSVTISSFRSEVCTKESTTLTASGAVSYTWNVTPNAVFTPTLKVTPVNTSTYSVTGVGTNNCMQTSSKTISVSTCNGIEGAGEKLTGISVYPNPSNGDVTISSLNAGTLRIVNIDGKIIRTVRVDEPAQRVTVTDLPAGIYFVVSGENSGLREKIVIGK